MKNAAKILVLFMVIMLFPVFSVNAENATYLVKFRAGFRPDVFAYNLKEVNAERGIYSSENPEDLTPIEEYITCISHNREVTLIESKMPIVPFSVPEDTLYQHQWQLQLIHADSAWDLESYGNDIRVAVIDSGCYAHDDLKNNLLQGKNYIEGTTDVTDNNGHGTHVSGIIAAEMNNVGIAGVAPKAKIVPLKCFDPSQKTYVDDVLDAIYDAVDVYGCKVINMSWGMPGGDPLLKEALDYAYEKGVILVASVGNEGTDVLYYPAAYDNVIGVGSVDENKEKSYFSQYNTSVTVVASGEWVKSTYKDGTYQEMIGTSQAAPMITGIAAAVLSMNEKMTPAAFKELLVETAEDLGTEGYDTRFGYGLADEDAFIEKMMQGIDYYVSPMNTKNGVTSVLIKNNTETDLEALSIFSKCSNNLLSDVGLMPITVLSGEKVTVETEDSGEKITHFLWSGMEHVMPLAAKREKPEAESLDSEESNSEN